MTKTSTVYTSPKLGVLEVKTTRNYYDYKKKIYYINDKNTNTYSVMNHNFDIMNRFKQPKDLFYMLALGPYVDERGALVYEGNRHVVKDMGKDDIARVLKVTERYAKDFINRMKKANILYLEKSVFNNGRKRQRYYVNPAVIHKVGRISPEAYYYFSKDLEDSLSESVKRDLLQFYLENYKPAQVDNAVEFLSDTEEEEYTSMDIFNQYVLDNKDPEYYHLDNGKLNKGFNDTNCFYLLQESDSNGRKADNIIMYRNLFLDLDSGKNESGEYYNGSELESRKEKLLNAVNRILPDPTSIIETRNGYHIIYSIEPTSDKRVWQEAQAKLVESFVLADNIKDSSRLLRMPGTIWNKDINKYDTFLTKVIDGNPIRYDISDLSKVFDYDSIKKESELVAKELGIHISTSSNTSSNKDSAGVSAADSNNSDNSRIKDLAMLKEIPELKSPVVMMMSEIDFKEYVRLYDMNKLFNLSGVYVKCLMHNDSHASAMVVKSSCDNVYRMFCFNPECEAHNKAGADNIDVMMSITGLSYKKVMEYFSRLFNIKVR